MDNEFSNLSNFNSSPKRASSPKRKAFVYLILFIVIIGAAIFAGNYFLSQNTGNSEPTPTPFSTPTPTIELTPTPTATPSAAPTGKSTPTPAMKVSPTTVSTTKTLEIEVLNGSGTPGEAGKAASVLKTAGYTVTSTGNAETFDYQLTVIQIKKSKQQLATQLKNDLSASYTVDPKIQTLADTASSDAIVIVGAK